MPRPASPDTATRMARLRAARAVAEGLHSAALHLLRHLRRQDVHPDAPVGTAGLSVLSVLVFGGPQTMSQLARIEQVQRPTMSRLVAALERDLLVTREVDRGDRRVVRVAATASGTGVMRYARERRVHALANLLQGLSAAELDQLGRAAELIEGLLRRG